MKTPTTIVIEADLTDEQLAVLTSEIRIVAGYIGLNLTIQSLDKMSSFVKPDKVDGQWLSPVPSERAWQEEKLVEIFGHYPNASPRWQYLNGLIQIALDHK